MTDPGLVRMVRRQSIILVVVWGSLLAVLAAMLAYNPSLAHIVVFVASATVGLLTIRCWWLTRSRALVYAVRGSESRAQWDIRLVKQVVDEAQEQWER